MNPRSIIGIALVCATLTACGARTTLTYTVTTNVPDNGRQAQLFLASERVMERRLAGADVRNAEVTVVPTSSGSATMTMKLPNAAAIETAERILSEPFTFDIRLEGPKLPATEENPEGINWIATGINGSMLEWISPVVNQTNDQIGVELVFTQEGRTILDTTFKGNKGKNIGIFVRDLLVSRMQINADEAGDHIVIDGIPSSKVAEIFSDDVNVGLHVTFTPAS